MAKSKSEFLQLVLLCVVVVAVLVGLVIFILNKVSKKGQINVGEEVDNLVKCENNRCSK